MTPSERWLTALESRHFSDLTFQEVSRSLRALSATYVERRDRLREGAALSGAGKRAAFAVFYGPLHYLLVREIVRAIPEAGATFSGSPDSPQQKSRGPSLPEHLERVLLKLTSARASGRLGDRFDAQEKGQP